MVKEIREIREKGSDELRQELRELRTELRDMRTKVRLGGSVDKPGRIRVLKRRIARILTVLNERESK